MTARCDLQSQSSNTVHALTVGVYIMTQELLSHLLCRHTHALVCVPLCSVLCYVLCWLVVGQDLYMCELLGINTCFELYAAYVVRM